MHENGTDHPMLEDRWWGLWWLDMVIYYTY